jgi:hypothetical protein|tara:strand:- start:675 stop:1508 length:834 start_codon:yes stop_codon:yes gene_type:complete
MSKVALCLSGKIGNIQGKSGFFDSDPRVLVKGHEHYQRHIIDKNDVDVFVHCWDGELEEKTIELYNPVHSVFEEQIYFDIPDYVKGEDARKNNHYSRWYSNKMVNEYRKNHEDKNNFQYDYVMTTRFDLAFETDIVFDNFDNEHFYSGKWSTVVDQNGNDLFKGGRGPLYDLLATNHPVLPHLTRKTKGYPVNDEGFLDLWFFANSKNSSDFFSLYDCLDEYNKPGNCDTDSSGRISNHRLVKYHLEKLNLLNKLRFEFHMFDDFPEVRRKYFGCRK